MTLAISYDDKMHGVTDDYLLVAREVARRAKNHDCMKRYLCLYRTFPKYSATRIIVNETLQALGEQNGEKQWSYLTLDVYYQLFSAIFHKDGSRASIPDGMIAKLSLRQRGKCPYCHKVLFDPVVDHIIPWTIVGDELGEVNFQALCAECNAEKSSAIHNIKIESV